MPPTKNFDGYKITRPEIGKGGAGVVHEAVAPDGKRVAIKVLNKEAIEAKIVKLLEEKEEEAGSVTKFTTKTRNAYEQQVESFKKEYQTIVGLKHPNIAEVYKIGFFEGHFYIVSEYIEGQSIANYVLRWKPVDMVPLFVQGLRALDFIHRNGLVHLDIKSDNILVQDTDKGPLAKIIDFGLAMPSQEYEGEFVGSISSMAPEVILGLKDKVDARSDLFSFGVVMYFCITWGSLPLPRPIGENKEFVRNYIKEHEAVLRLRPPSRAHHSRPGYAPQYLDTIVMRLLAHQPEDRYYGNARAVINALTTHMPDAFEDSADTLGSYLRPELNKYIGRDKEVLFIENSVNTLVKGKNPDSPISRIEGEDGFGKTHLLNHITEVAQKNIEHISIHFITFPSGYDSVEQHLADLAKDISDNEKPQLLLIDNLHELAHNSHDPAKVIAVIEGLVRTIVERKNSSKVYADIKPFLLIFTFNSDAIKTGKTSKELLKLMTGDFKFRGILKTIKLNPFTQEDIKTYLQMTPAFRDKELAKKDIKVLYDRTKGIPRELVETLDEYDRNGIIFDAAGEIAVADVISTKGSKSKIPHSTHDRLLGKYKGLSSLECELADFLACWCYKPFLPRPTSNDITTSLGRRSVMQTMRDLINKEIIHHSLEDDSYSFVDNDYMPSLMHGMMDIKQRGHFHDIMADYLGSYDKRASTFHRAFGSDKAKALRSAVFLGKKFLFEDGNCNVAIELFENALNLADKSQRKLSAYILTLLIDSYLYDGRLSMAEEAINDGLNLVRGFSTYWEIRFKLSKITCMLQKEQFEEAKRFIDALKMIFQGNEKTILYAVLLNHEGRYYYQMALTSPDRSVDFLEKAKSLYEESSSLEKLLNVPSEHVKNNDLPFVLRELGDYTQAAEKLEKQLYQEKLDVFRMGVVYVALSDTYRFAQSFDKALECAHKALSLAKKTNLSHLLLGAHGVLANVYHAIDEFKKSVEECNRQLALHTCIDSAEEYKYHSARLWTHIGHCYKELKNWNKAIVYFDAAVIGSVRRFLTMSAYEGLGEVYYHKNEYDKEFDYFRQAEHLLEKMPDSSDTNSYRYRITYLKADSYFRKKDMEKARELLPKLKLLIGKDEKRKKEYTELEKEIKV